MGHNGLITLGLCCASCLLVPGVSRAAETVLPAGQPDVVSALKPLRAALRADRVEWTFSRIQRVVNLYPTDARPLSLLGDVFFRQARFDAAQRAYQAALKLDSNSSRAYRGLGQLARLRSRNREARDFFAKAYQLNPRDPDVILSYAEWVQERSAREVLLRNFLALSDTADRIRLEDVKGRLELIERLGDRRLQTLATANRHYHFQLTGFYPDGPTRRGVLLAVRINDGKPLHLLIDTGADGIVISRRALPGSGLEVLTSAGVRGFGSEDLTGSVALARSIGIGDLRIENCPLQVVDGQLTPGADGVIGTDLFEQFLIRLDMASPALDLDPLPEEANATQRAPSPFYRLGHLLLIKPDHGSGQDDYFLLDTGASLSAVSYTRSLADLAGPVAVQGSSGAVEDASQAAPVHLDFGGYELVDSHPLSLDLRRMSWSAGADIAGIIGYPMLRHAVVTINYRDGILNLEKSDH